MHGSNMIEDHDKQYLSGSFIARNDFFKQNSIYQGTNSARLRKKLDEQTVFEGESDHQDSLQWDQNEKEKLAELRVKLKNMKDKIRAQNLVMNLPSRMFKNLDQNKFNLLGDNTYNDEHVHIQQIALQEKRLKDEKRALRRKTQPAPHLSLVVNSILQSNDQESADTLDMNSNKNMQRKAKSKKTTITINRFLKNQMKWLLKQNEKIFNSIPVLQPSSMIKVIWDVLYTLVILICMFILPIVIVFDYSYAYLIPRQFVYILPLILIMDILVNMNTGYFDKGQVVKNRIHIIYFYWKKNFISDIISVIPFIISLFCDPGFESNSKGESISTHTQSWIQSPIYKILLMTFFFKVHSLSQVFRKIEERFNLSKRITNLFQLMKLLFTIILINHLFACLWVYVARLEEDYPIKTWITEAKIQDKEWHIKYLTAYYFTTVTMITVGYGDILPRNEVEMILCVITMMLACGVFGYSLNEVGLIFSNFFQVDNEIKKKIGFIQRFMSKKNVNQKLQYEIREYLEYYWRETSEMNQEMEQHIITQLSESLRSKLLYEANKIVFKDSPIFKRNFSKSTMEQIVPLIQEMKFTPESFICLKGIQDDASIYFIENGSVEVLLEPKDQNSKSVFQLNKGDSFGAHTFFTGLPRVNNIRSKEFTTVLKIRRQDFLQLIQSNSEDYETFCGIRDSISYLNDYSKIGLSCRSCNSQYHLVNECQYLHFIPNKAKIIKFYNDTLNVSNSQRVFQLRRTIPKKYNYRNARYIFREVESQAEMQLVNYFINANEMHSNQFIFSFFPLLDIKLTINLCIDYRKKLEIFRKFENQEKYPKISLLRKIISLKSLSFPFPQI